VIPRYLLFHAVFLLPPLALLAAWRAGSPSRRLRLGLAILVPVALAYTIPWDGYLIRQGVWWYGDNSVAATIWRIPVGEYLFIAVQPVITGLWAASLDWNTAAAGLQSRRDRVVGALAGLAVAAVGVGLLLLGESTFYLGALVAWGGPVLAIQWAFDWRYLWARRRTLAAAVGVPTLYFAVADRVAIEFGIWVLSGAYTIGITVAGLPVEEGAFFLLTNAFVVQGLALFFGLLATLELGRDAPRAATTAND
jgi:lycopene cyclase domain-containing protein